MDLDSWRHRAGAVADGADPADIRRAAERSHGPNETFTVDVRRRLADRRGASGDAAGAVAELEALLADVSAVVGEERPEILEARRDLARWRAEAGDPDRAVTELEGLVPDTEAALGARHLITMDTRAELFRLRGRTGDLQGAALVYERLFDDAERLFGAESARALGVFGELARAEDPSGGVGAAMVLGGWRRAVKRLPASESTGTEPAGSGFRGTVYARSAFEVETLGALGLGALPAAHRGAMIEMLEHDLVLRAAFKNAGRQSEEELLERLLSRKSEAPQGGRGASVPPVDPGRYHAEFESLCAQVERVAPDLLLVSEQAVAG